MEEQKPEQGFAQEQVEAMVQQAANDLAQKLGPGTRVVLMAARGDPGKWGYCWSIRGDHFGILGLMEHVGQKIKGWISGNL